MYGSIFNTDASKPTWAQLTNGSNARSAEVYRKVVEQFGVETNPRYTSRDGKTYCNIFVWDVTRAMGCEIPHWEVAYKQVGSEVLAVGVERNANDVCDWLEKYGAACGWTKCKATEVNYLAEQGKPVVACYKSPARGIGHVAMVIPDVNTSLPGMQPIIAQAGAVNFYGFPMSRGFGNLPVTFWYHN